MKPEELRIGNFALLDDNKIVRIIWFKLGNVCIMKLGVEYPSTIVDMERLKPIELTEEWLLKFGFQRQPWGLIIGSLLFKDKNHECKELTLEVGNGFRTTVKHVHQLQNLFYSLTGTELKINEL